MEGDAGSKEPPPVTSGPDTCLSSGSLALGGPPPPPPNTQPLPHGPSRSQLQQSRVVGWRVGAPPRREHIESSPRRWRLPLTCQPEERHPRQRDPVHLPQLPIQGRVREPSGSGAGAGSVCATGGRGGGGRERCPRPRAPPRRTARTAQARCRSAATPLPHGSRSRSRTPGSRRRARPAAPPAARPAASKVSGSRAGPAGSTQRPSAPGAPGAGARAARSRTGPAVGDASRGGCARASGTERPGRDPPGLGAAHQRVPWARGCLRWAPPLRLGRFLTRKEPRCSAELEKVDGNPAP